MLDTVAHAAATPEVEMPYAALGLKADEYARICEILGRRPTHAELAMYSVMWSEHCSYKSSKVHLSEQIGKKTTEAMRANLLAGVGENAGVVSIGDGWAVTFKVESHNHPSYVEPYQGAATGVGGIVRDIMAMGARPVAVMDQLRFGAVDHPDTARVVRGVVAGVAGYGNCLGLPNIGGETVFDPAYQGNPLVNALCVGVLRDDDLRTANASGAGNAVILFGARTGGDGIGGASILASEVFDGGVPAKRPSVQVGDPFMEKVLIECCLELFDAEVVEGIQDLGAAGISCATSELASNGDGGMHVNLDQVLLRDPTLTPGEILMSESQERMMAVCRPENLEAFFAITDKWEVEATVIGTVNDSGRLTIDYAGERIVDVDPRTVAHDGPTYHRPYSRPAGLDSVQADGAAPLITADLEAMAADGGATLTNAVETVLLSPNQATPAWVTDQYDRYVRGNTAMATPGDAGVIRVDETTGKGIALATDANGWFTTLDPYTGAQLALGEAMRNVITTGATPLAVTNCLNFGSPEEPELMWQFVEALRGLADGCLERELPITGGNVSFYNTSGGESIHPTPVVGVLGVLDDVRRATPTVWAESGLEVFLLGETETDLDGSAWARDVHHHLGGLPPAPKLEATAALEAVLGVNGGEADGTKADGGKPDGADCGCACNAYTPLIAAAHDVSTGGLVATLTEMARRVGGHFDLTAVGPDPITTFFSETQARVVVAVNCDNRAKLEAKAAAAGIPLTRLGSTGGSEITVESHGYVWSSGIEELAERSRSVLHGIFDRE